MYAPPNASRTKISRSGLTPAARGAKGIASKTGNALKQQIRFFSFAKQSLRGLLALSPPPFTSADHAFLQLQYVQQYVQDLGCQTLLTESHYIDRDHMED